jgi:hypothetical protein
MKAGKIEIRGKNFPTAILRDFQFCTDLKTEKWMDAKNAIDRKENSRSRIKEGQGFENWKKVFDVLDKIFGGFVFVCVFVFVCLCLCLCFF